MTEEEDEATLAAIDQGIKDANEGRSFRRKKLASVSMAFKIIYTESA